MPHARDRTRATRGPDRFPPGRGDLLEEDHVGVVVGVRRRACGSKLVIARLRADHPQAGHRRRRRHRLDGVEHRWHDPRQLRHDDQRSRHRQRPEPEAHRGDEDGVRREVDPERERVGEHEEAPVVKRQDPGGRRPDRADRSRRATPAPAAPGRPTVPPRSGLRSVRAQGVCARRATVVPVVTPK